MKIGYLKPHTKTALNQNYKANTFNKWISKYHK